MYLRVSASINFLLFCLVIPTLFLSWAIRGCKGVHTSVDTHTLVFFHIVPTYHGHYFSYTLTPVTGRWASGSPEDPVRCSLGRVGGNAQGRSWRRRRRSRGGERWRQGQERLLRGYGRGSFVDSCGVHGACGRVDGRARGGLGQ